jgi:hypothetical protein
MNFWFLIFWLSFFQIGCATEILKLSLTPSSGMQRADLYYIPSDTEITGVLVLCPGQNGSGEGMLKEQAWQQFAQIHHLGLVGLSFASEDLSPEHQTGYYYASKGSGQILLDGIRQIYGKNLPMVFFGFSGGALFTSYFLEWKPEMVITWSVAMMITGLEPRSFISSKEGAPENLGAGLISFKQAIF